MDFTQLGMKITPDYHSDGSLYDYITPPTTTTTSTSTSTTASTSSGSSMSSTQPVSLAQFPAAYLAQHSLREIQSVQLSFFHQWDTVSVVQMSSHVIISLLFIIVIIIMNHISVCLSSLTHSLTHPLSFSLS